MGGGRSVGEERVGRGEGIRTVSLGNGGRLPEMAFLIGARSLRMVF